MGFVELNGKIYCENDYESFFAPKCAKCRQAIIGVSLIYEWYMYWYLYGIT